MHTEPILDELHRHRQEMMERFNYDFEAFFKYIKEQEALSQLPVIPAPTEKASPPGPSPRQTRFVRG